MQTRLLLCFCVFGIVSAEDGRSSRQVHFRITQNGTMYLQPEISVLPRKISSVFPNAKSFMKSSTVTSARENLITEPIVVNDSTPLEGTEPEGKDDVSIPVPVTFLSNDTESTPQSRSTSSVQIVQRNKAIPVPVLVKAPPNAFRPVASTPRPFVPSPVEKEPPSNPNDLENPFSVLTSSFRLWPKLPEPVPVPVLAPQSFAKKFHEKSSAYVGPQYHPKPFIPATPPASNAYQQNPVPVQYPANSQPQVQPSQPPNQGPIYLIIPGNNNAQPSPGGYQAPSQTPLPSQPQAGNQNYIILQSPTGANSQSSVPYQFSQNNGYSQNQGYSINQQNQQPTSYPNYAMFASPNTLGGQQAQTGQQTPSGQQAQSGQQAPLTFLLLGPSNAAGSQSQSVDQQAASKYAIFGVAGNQANLGGQAPAAGFSSYTPQNVPASAGNSANSAGQTPLNFALLAPSNLPANPTNSQGQAQMSYAVFSAPNSQGNQAQASQPPQNFTFSSAQVPVQSNNQPTLIALPVSSNTGSGFPSSTASPNVGFSSTQYAFATQSPSSQYAGFSTPTPNAQSNYYQPNSSPQYFGVSSTQTPAAQPNYYQQTSSPQYFGVSSTSAPSAQPNYYQPTSSPQFFGASSTPAQPNYYQTASPSQFTGFPSSPTSTAQPNYYQPTSSPQFTGFSSTPAPTAQPNYYQSTSAPQYSVSSDAQSNFYQSTSSPQNFGYSSTPSPTADPSYSSSTSSQVRFSGNGGSYSYFV